MSATARRLFTARRGDDSRNWWAVTIGDDELFYGGWSRVRTLVSYLNRWQPDDEELASFFSWLTPEAREYVDAMQRITLRFPAVCVRCGQQLAAGARASWDPSTKVIVHGARCPLKVPPTP